MFTTLPESRAIRTRSARSTMASVVLHSVLIAGAVAMTLPTPVDARPEPVDGKKIIYVPIRPTAHVSEPAPKRVQPTQPTAPRLTIAAPSFTPKTLPPIDVNAPEIPPDLIIIGGPGARTGPPVGPVGPSVPTTGSVVDVAVVERIPRILANAPTPSYPGSLRASGIAGQVVVRFVVDTLGRAEMDGLVVQEASHALFADAVRNVLGLYRFSPGEVGGRKVRTMVQLPFTFALR